MAKPQYHFWKKGLQDVTGRGINFINNKGNLFCQVCRVQMFGVTPERSVCVYVCQTEGSVDESQRDRHGWSESEGMSLPQAHKPC